MIFNGNPLLLWDPQTIFAGMNDTQCTPKGVSAKTIAL